ncbi:acetyltransferase [Microbacterium aurum]
MRVVIAGAGGHGREIHMWLSLSPRFLAANEITEVVFISDVPVASPGLEVVGPIAGFEPGPDDRLIVALGDVTDRINVVGALAACGGRFLTFVHDDAIVAPTAELGIGCIVFPRVVISPQASIGDHVHFNLGASAAHDTVVGEFTTLSPGSMLLGGSIVGRSCYIGAGAVVLPRIRVGDRVTVGAQAAVTRDSGDDCTVVGVPAGVIRC